jgi:hypothetical protein
MTRTIIDPVKSIGQSIMGYIALIICIPGCMSGVQKSIPIREAAKSPKDMITKTIPILSPLNGLRPQLNPQNCFR